ncbi:BTAD domain-containing putative transcriptional regulator [Actinocrispum sp. NPDC049592]|uniref:AfsR/SARP family transcriptional regulator n=1 Tax=Actinocrispum sp. NPDC049592 TaxID=3154835 RepID=UPI003426CB4D
MGEFQILGRVQAIGPAGPAVLQGTRQRAVLGMLALHAGQVLPVGKLVDVVWGEDPPRTAVRTLHSHVARIRQALDRSGFDPVLRTSNPGYVLDVDASTVDALLFEQQVRVAKRHAAEGAVDRAASGFRRALDLWHGEAFADAALTGWGLREADRLHELRLSTVESFWDAELQLGKHEEAVRELARLLAEHPTREVLAGLQMLALYRSGRHTEALGVFQTVRLRLADELGTEPGPELLALHSSILRRDASLDAPQQMTTGPAQLPARVGHFTGREAELAALDQLLDESEPPVVVISGTAGMGKTALAVQWAHRVAGRFPDGQLFVDVRGHDPRRMMSSADALAHLLRSLGMPEDRIPGGIGDREALYRSLVHGKRCVIVVDNAGDVEHVLPLVPGGTRTLLIVTSRKSLAALGTRYAVRMVPLDAFKHDASIALLSSVLGADRVDRERGPAARLARLCGGMPLALRIAAARLAGEPARPIAGLAGELAGADRLDALAVDGDTRTVRTVLASAYLPLELAQTRMFRLLGLTPGTTFTASLGAAMCGVPAKDGRRATTELKAAHLIMPVGEDRFRFHDLIREFARQCARTDEPEAATAEAGHRLVDWYLLVASAANKAIDPNRDLVTSSLRYEAPELPFAPDRHAAVAFLEGERHNLVPAARFARESGRLTAAWHFTYLLTSFYDATGHWQDRVELCRQGAAAAAELGDPLAEAEMLRALGVSYYMTRRLQDAVNTNILALRAVRAAGDLDGEGHVYNNLANAYSEMRRFDEAVEAHQMAVARCAAVDNHLGHALSQRNLGSTLIQMGRAAESLEPLTEALARFRKLDTPRLEAATLDTLGEAYLELGDDDLALNTLQEAVTLLREIGYVWTEMEALLHTGAVYLRRKDFAAAAEQFELALALAREHRAPHIEAVALDRLGRACLGRDDLRGAREHLELALSIRGAVPDGYEHAHLYRDLGDLEDRLGRPAVASAHRSRAVELYRQENATAEALAIEGLP